MKYEVIPESWSLINSENRVSKVKDELEKEFWLFNKFSNEWDLRVSVFSEIIKTPIDFNGRLFFNFVSANPKIIIFPYIGNNKNQELKIKPFSTIDAAVNWVVKT